MKWEEFIKLVGKLPVIDAKILLPGHADYKPAKVQISRWEKARKIIQVKRGLYVLAEPYRKVTVFEPYLASLLKRPSYISLEKALEYHGLIPEAVTVYTSVTTKRPSRFESSIGVFVYRHIKNSLFWGYESITVNGQTAFIASPEKALLDFFYLKEVKITNKYLKEMRLQNVEKLDCKRLAIYAKKFKKPGISHAAEILEKYVSRYTNTEKIL